MKTPKKRRPLSVKSHKPPPAVVVGQSKSGGDPSAPPPEVLHELASQERNRKLLRKHRDTIELLRDEKDFSFREIADWLTEHGVDADHNSVYREYMSTPKPEEEREEDEAA